MRDGRRFITRCRVIDRDIDFYLGQIVINEWTDGSGLGFVFSITHFLEGEPTIGIQELVADDELGFQLSPERVWKTQSRVIPFEDEESGDYYLSVDQETGKCGLYRCNCSEWEKADRARKAITEIMKVPSDD